MNGELVDEFKIAFSMEFSVTFEPDGLWNLKGCSFELLRFILSFWIVKINLSYLFRLSI